MEIVYRWARVGNRQSLSAGQKNYEEKLIETIAEILRIRYEIIYPFDSQWGTKQTDGNWTGMIGMLQRQEADLALDIVSMTYDRSRVITFSYPYFAVEETFLVRRGQELPKTFIYLYPFTMQLWFAVVFIVIFCAIVLKLLTHFEKVFDKQRRDRSLAVAVFDTFARFMKQGNLKQYRRCSRSVCIFLSIWLLVSNVLVFSYTGNILSFAMTPPMEPTIQTMEELQTAVLSGKYKIISPKGSSVTSNLLEATDGAAKVFGDNLRQYPEGMFTNLTIAFQQVHDQPLALHKGKFPVNSSEIVFLKDTLNWSFYAIAFRKNFKGTERFNTFIHRLWLSGLYKKWMKDYYQNYRQTFSKAKTVRPLTLQDLSGALFMLCIGHAVAIVVFILTKILYHCDRCKWLKNDHKITS